MPRIRTRIAKNWARNFAAGLLENAEPEFQEFSGLSEDEMLVAKQELERLANRIQATVNNNLLPANGSN